MDFPKFQGLNNLANVSSYVPNLLKSIDCYDMDSLSSNSGVPSVAYSLFMHLYESGDTYLSLFLKADKKWGNLLAFNGYAILSKIEPFVTDATYNKYATMCTLGMIKDNSIINYLSNDEISMVRKISRFIPYIQYLHQTCDKQPSKTDNCCSTKIVRKEISGLDKNYKGRMDAFFCSNFNQLLVNEWLDFLEIRLNIASIIKLSPIIEDGSVRYIIKTNTDSVTISYSVINDAEIEYINMRKEKAKKELEDGEVLSVIKNYKILVAKYLSTDN